jgi:hypothetical protein
MIPMSAPRLWASIAAVSCAAALCGLTSVGVAAAGTLPDGRVYEMVSPPEGFDNETYQPELNDVGIKFSSTWTQFPFQASADGDKVAYVGGPTVGGSESSGWKGGNEYLGTRSAGGTWTQTNITPSASSFIFQAFSSDLSVAFLDGTEPLTALSPGFGEGVVPSYDVLYATGTGSGEYTPVFTVKPPYRTQTGFSSVNVHFPGIFGPTHGGRYEGQIVAFAGASADDSHVLFLANDALTAASEGRPAAEGGSAGNYEKENNLYEAVGGQLRLVNVLPNGTTHANATFGGGVTAGLGDSRFSHVISKDGSRIFWTDMATGHIYMRENGATTVEISPAGKYQTATGNGSMVFFTNGDLYSYEVETAQTNDLTPGEPVEKVVGTSENGEYVYYVTNGGVLKVWHDGASTVITSSPAATAEVTPDGHSIVFTSTDEKLAPISVYDVDTGLVYCASCSGSGTEGVLPVTNKANVYQPRWISADGAHVFFDSNEAFVPQDTNGVLDVYEWDRPGADGCTQSGGCVYLLSGGSSTEASYFADASESGNDAFVVTRAKLLGADDNELYDLYDLRVDGFVPPAPPACTGTGCQGVPGAPPIFATPSSVTFEGVGNFAPRTQVAAAKPKAKHKKKKDKKKGSKKRNKAQATKGHTRSKAKGGRR